MTATLNGQPPDTRLASAIRRADRAWCQDRRDEPLDPERLTALAAALLERGAVAHQADTAELKELREHVARLDDQLELARQDTSGWQASAEGAAAARTELERTLQTARAEHRRNLDEARAELANARAVALRANTEVEKLTAQLAEASRHTCSWEISADDGSYQPCSCGRIWPRYAAAERGLDVEPRLSGWDAIWVQVRAELVGWGR